MMNYYKCRYYFNASHSVGVGNVQTHPHTFTVTLFLKPGEDVTFLSFDEMDREIQKVLSQFEGKNLNLLKVFEKEAPTIERIAQILNQEVTDTVQARGLTLLHMELNETPLRGYIVRNVDISRQLGESKRKQSSTGYE